MAYAAADEVNRIASDDIFSYVYDDNGNLISKTETAAPFGVTQYAHDVQHQLVQVTRPHDHIVWVIGFAIERTGSGPSPREIIFWMENEIGRSGKDGHNHLLYLAWFGR